MQFEKWYDIDLKKPRQFVPDIGFPTFEGDNNSVRIGVNMFSDKAPSDVTGTIKGYCILPNGVALMPWDGAKDGNRAWIDVPDDALIMNGRITLSIRCFDADETTVLFQASATVRRVDSERHYDPEDEIGDVTDLIEEAERVSGVAAQAAQDAQDALAQASDIVSYATQTGKTDAQKATARTNIGAASEGDVSDLKGALTSMELNKLVYTIIPNSYVATNGTITNYNGWSRTDYTYVANYAVLKAITSAQSAFNCFYDSSKSFISSFTVKTTETEIEVPQNAAYVIFSNTNAGMANLDVSYVTKDHQRLDDVEEQVASVLQEGSVADILYQYNIYDPTIAISGKYWNTNNELTNYASYSVGDYIPIEPDVMYFVRDFTTDNTTQYYVTVFDDEYNPLLTVYNGQSKINGFYSGNGSYVAISAPTSSFNNKYLICNAEKMLGENNTPDKAVYLAPGVGKVLAANPCQYIRAYHTTAAYGTDPQIKALVYNEYNHLSVTYPLSKVNGSVYAYIPKNADNRWGLFQQLTGLGDWESWSRNADVIDRQTTNDSTHVRFSIPANNIDNSYAYDKDSGTVFFAGKNTPYYGCSSIYEVSNAASYNMSAELLEVYKTSKAAMESTNGKSYNKITFIVTTDQHGRFRHGAYNRVMKWIADEVDIDYISGVINLGDTVVDKFIENGQEKTILADYMEMMKVLPPEKVIDVVGNHDVATFVPYRAVAQYFPNARAELDGTLGCFVLKDNAHCVKYVSFNLFEDRRSTENSFYIIKGKTAEWLIKALSEDDGMDIILLSHVPITTDGMTNRSSGSPSYSETIISDSTVCADFIDMLNSRFNKGTGSFTDSEGNTHTYDFSSQRGDLLMSLHGHSHEEFYGKLGSDGLTTFAFDWFDGNTTYFCEIDRQEKTFKTWKTEIGVSELELDIS